MSPEDIKVSFDLGDALIYWKARTAQAEAEVRVLRGALQRVEWVHEFSSTYEGTKCHACGALKRPGRGHNPGCSTEGALLAAPAAAPRESCWCEEPEWAGGHKPSCPSFVAVPGSRDEGGGT